MLRTLLFSVAAFGIFLVHGQAHPPIGMVQDSKGNIYFTDNAQVWKISTEGKVSLAVEKVHTHELCIDKDDNLFGEHLWYEGNETGKWKHRVWKRSATGEISDVVPSRQGFLSNYSFVRDREGVMYWVDRKKGAVMKRASIDGKIETHATGELKEVGWMTATADGVLFLMDHGDLKKVSTAGTISTVAKRVTYDTLGDEKVTKLNYHMGVWTDTKGRIYVAVAAERKTMRIDTDGVAEMVAPTGNPWAPSGGLIDRDGRLWLLEYDDKNAVRARRLERGGKETIFETKETGS